MKRDVETRYVTTKLLNTTAVGNTQNNMFCITQSYCIRLEY